MDMKARTSTFLLLTAAMILFISAFTAGCVNTDSSDLPTSPDGQTAAESPSSSSSSDDGTGVPADLAGVVWLHTDVSGWAVTSDLRSVNVSGGAISLDYDKADVWPAKNHAGANVNANPWIFVNVGGVWHAATFEWFRKGQTAKPVGTVAGNHINKAPLSNFRPQSGVTYGFMVSGLARDNARNVEERTQVVKYTWP